MKLYGAVFVTLMLAGCVSFQDPVPAGYTGPTANIIDTYTNWAGSTAHFFVLAKVDGKAVEDSEVRTRVNNSGRGFQMTPNMVSRPVMAKSQTFTISGFVQFATDAQAMFGDFMRISGDVTFTPKAGESYRVVGELSKTGSSVWIVDSTDAVVISKISDKN